MNISAIGAATPVANIANTPSGSGPPAGPEPAATATVIPQFNIAKPASSIGNGKQTHNVYEIADDIQDRNIERITISQTSNEGVAFYYIKVKPQDGKEYQVATSSSHDVETIKTLAASNETPIEERTAGKFEKFGRDALLEGIGPTVLSTLASVGLVWGGIAIGKMQYNGYLKKSQISSKDIIKSRLEAKGDWHDLRDWDNHIIAVPVIDESVKSAIHHLDKLKTEEQSTGFNMIFYGRGGTGKTTTVMRTLAEIQDHYGDNLYTLEFKDSPDVIAKWTIGLQPKKQAELILKRAKKAGKRAVAILIDDPEDCGLNTRNLVFMMKHLVDLAEREGMPVYNLMATNKDLGKRAYDGKFEAVARRLEPQDVDQGIEPEHVKAQIADAAKKFYGGAADPALVEALYKEVKQDFVPALWKKLFARYGNKSISQNQLTQDLTSGTGDFYGGLKFLLNSNRDRKSDRKNRDDNGFGDD